MTPLTRRRPRSDREKFAERIQRQPGYFITDVLGQFAWSKQLEVVESVRDHRRTAVRSGHGVGKTYTAAAAVLWFLYSFPNSRVITTATKWSQVKNLLWHEVNLLYARSRVHLGGRCLLTELHLPDGRYAIGLSTKPGQEESFAGHHAEHILLVFDEASGIPAPVYEVGEGYMTTDGARWLMIGNPTRPDGEFYAAFHSKRGEYNCIHIDASKDSPPLSGEPVPPEVASKLTGPAWVEERRRMWGEGSMLWDIRVAGNFPRQAEDAVVGVYEIEAAQERELELAPDEERVIACDVARFGSDETVIAERIGRRIRLLEIQQGQDTMETAGRVLRHVREGGGRVVVDDVGVGGGVTDRLREQGVSVTAHNGGHAPRDEDEYPNRRSELWFDAADQLDRIDLDQDDQLAADLLAPRYKVDSKGRRVVEPKEETKKRLGRSPDRADAVLMTFVQETKVRMEVW